MNHKVMKCAYCSGVMMQCRCPGPHELEYGVCDGCKHLVKFPRIAYGLNIVFDDEMQWAVFKDALNVLRMNLEKSGATVALKSLNEVIQKVNNGLKRVERNGCDDAGNERG